MSAGNVEQFAKRERDLYNLSLDKEDETKSLHVGVNTGNMHNVVDELTLRRVQSNTLREAKEFLSRTFGPMGSNTMIITGNNRQSISATYSKDGLKVLKNIANSGPIEASIIEELIETSTHVEKEVGDGTTSTVILSSLIFDHLLEIKNKYNLPPFQLIRLFKEEVNKIKKLILDSKKDCTVDDIYDISMISTNGNTEIAENLKAIYEKYGMDVDLTVGISNTSESMVRVYDGLTITEGMADPVFVNKVEKREKDKDGKESVVGVSEIHNAKVYHFVDPIDDAEQISFFESIIEHNIYEPLANEEAPIPTVITCPKLSKDLSATLTKLTNQLYQYSQAKADNRKPPVLIITNVLASDELIMDDIANLCGCKNIKKYINPDVKKRDIESGIAATIDTVYDFAGECELVVADANKTKFINPKHMHVIDAEGNVADDPVYTAMVNQLRSEIENADPDENAVHIGLLKKRLSALKANMAEYLIGGVTIADRDATKDLAEDAIKNCLSAAKYGVGNAANFDALRFALRNIHDNIFEVTDKDGFLADEDNNIHLDIARCIYNAYFEIQKILYGTVCNDTDKVEKYICYSIDAGHPYDISSGELPENMEDVSSKVLCTIQLDVQILDTLSKIVSLSLFANQALLQVPELNTYHFD